MAAPALEFHQSIPGYSPTPLVAVPALAESLGAEQVWIKDESDRFGLPAFKVLGASWATNLAVSARAGRPPARTFAELSATTALLTRPAPLTVVTATDGNHGRALAHIARLLGLTARIYVPAGLPAGTLRAIGDEGAQVVETGQVYDEAVRIANESCTDAELLIQDTAWTGYEEVPRWIVAGYSTLFAEIDVQLGTSPGLVVVPTGVGSLLQAAIEHYRASGRDGRTAILAVEPATAACVTASLGAGKPVSVDTAAPTVMAGLNCGTVSSTAWPVIERGLDAGIGVSDAETMAALGVLQQHGLSVGPCGAAALAGLQAAAGLSGGAQAVGLGPTTRAVLVSTEGIQIDLGVPLTTNLKD
ncbi:diaminopropionate ammonia-lyase [Kribbella solani]|uniref:Diaminopropionate ammonia-lyase n=1 Tax=Kribbella solani TaxID=236067 RepID=A0A841DQQ6_9ACTN|nr:diaminopropionate ammonia-lyase [Kribbella solani]MBB5980902.1 diaminopropionate ammonia-lyase [Kribbella solani]